MNFQFCQVVLMRSLGLCVVLSVILHAFAVWSVMKSMTTGESQPASEVYEVSIFDEQQVVIVPESQPISKRVFRKPVSRSIKKKASQRSRAQNPVTFPSDISSGEVSNKASPSGIQQVRLSYLQYLGLKLNRYKIYPRLAKRLKHEGKVVILMKISADGSLKEAVLSEKSLSSYLNRAALKLVTSQAPYKKLPEFLGEEIEVQVPILYELGAR